MTNETPAITPNRARKLRKLIRDGRAEVHGLALELRGVRAAAAARHAEAAACGDARERSEIEWRAATLDDRADGLAYDFGVAVADVRRALTKLRASAVVLGSAYSDTAARRVIANLDERRKAGAR